MFQSKRNDLLAGLVIIILLTLFVNFSFLMRWFERSSMGEQVSSGGPANVYFLYFSLGWFFLFSFVIFLFHSSVYKMGNRLRIKGEFKSFLFATGITLVLAFLLIQLYPVLQQLILEEMLDIQPPRPVGWGGGGGARSPEGLYEPFPDAPMPFFKPLRPSPFPRMLVTEHIFVLTTIILLVQLIRMLNTRQEMMLEVERLKTEKLQTSYNALMGQINPHFFFNSLNGLNSLIRGEEKEKTLTYLDELSQVFRYILQSNKKELVTLAEELQFVKAYTCLLSVRYEGKLFFSIQTDPPTLLSYLPILSILPLIENAVKHNVISKQHPLQIDIYTTSGNMLMVSNRIQLKNELTPSSGIGLKNLWGRYRMLTGKDILISNRKEYFKVSLPLLDKLPKT